MFENTAAGSVPQHQPGHGKLFVGQVPAVCTEEMLMPLFSSYGTLVEIKIMRDHQNRSKGCAWVRYQTTAMAQLAIDALNEKHTIPPQTNALKVQFAQPKSQAPQGLPQYNNLPPPPPPQQFQVSSLPPPPPQQKGHNNQQHPQQQYGGYATQHHTPPYSGQQHHHQAPYAQQQQYSGGYQQGNRGQQYQSHHHHHHHQQQQGYAAFPQQAYQHGGAGGYPAAWNSHNVPNHNHQHHAPK